MSLEKHAFDEDQLIRDFRLLAEKLADYGEKIGVKILPYHDEDLPHYASLPLDQKRSALQALAVYVDICSGAVESGYDLASPKLAWFALRKLGLRPPSDLFNCISDEDVLEIYDVNGVQVWRNFNFMGICSYTLEEVHSFPWFLRYDRSEADTEKIMKSVQKVLSAKECKVFHEAIGKHRFQEKFSEQRYLLEATHDYFCPLYYKTNQVSGFIVTSSVKIIGTRAQDSQQGRRPLEIQSKRPLEIQA